MRNTLFVLALFVQVSVFAAISNFQRVSDHLFRGARPSVSDLTELQRNLGVDAVLNLELGIFGGRPGSVDDEEAWAQSHHVEFFYLPMSATSRPSVEQVLRGLSFLNQRLEHKVFVHCLRGSDRTGIVIAAYRISHDHWTVDQAFAEMKQYGHDELLLPGWKNVLAQVAQRIAP